MFLLPRTWSVDCKLSLTEKWKSDKSVGFVKKIGSQLILNIDAAYDPFVCQRMISLSGSERDLVSVTMLRDTGANQSFVLASMLPFSEKSFCGSDVLIQGIELGVLKMYRYIMCTFDPV